MITKTATAPANGTAMTIARNKAVSIGKTLVRWEGKETASAQEALRLLESYSDLGTETAGYIKTMTPNQRKLFRAEWNKANQE
jgi:hypothetical protein